MAGGLRSESRRRDFRVILQTATQTVTGVIHPDSSLEALLAVLLVGVVELTVVKVYVGEVGA